jgi:ATP-dependent Clp protease protease subunit
MEDRIDEQLLKMRRIFLSDLIDTTTAKEIIRKLWYLEAISPGEEILFVINSPGGSIDAGFAIWDQIKLITSPVTTLVTGLAASMATVLLLSAPPKRRFATPNARFMIHQPSIHGVVRGQATDLEIQAKEILKTRDLLIELYCDETGQEQSVVEKALDRDTWMGPEGAIGFGLIFGIVNSFQEIGI